MDELHKNKSPQKTATCSRRRPTGWLLCLGLSAALTLGALSSPATSGARAHDLPLINADPNSRPAEASLANNLKQAMSTAQTSAAAAAAAPSATTTTSHLQQANSPNSQSQVASQKDFDPSAFKNVYEAIRGHPNLKMFGALCELDGVREIVSLDRSEMSVFAPIDSRALGDISASAKQRGISPSELAKHHIAPMLIMADETSQLPLKFSPIPQASPLFLSLGQHHAQARQLFVNNAKILATYLFPIEEGDLAGSHQVLHVIDAPLEFAYAVRKHQVRNYDGRARTSISRAPLNLDELGSGQAEQVAALEDFARRFSDLAVSVQRGVSAHDDDEHPDPAHLYSTRSDSKSQLANSDLSVEHFLSGARQFAPRLRSRLYATNETSSPAGQATAPGASGAPTNNLQLNTYFLPINSEFLDNLLDSSPKPSPPFFEAHVLPDQVLFTRQLGLGHAHPTLFNRQNSRSSKIHLNLAKSLENSGPLFVQSVCSADTEGGVASGGNECQPGVVSSEILLANIPLANGVLHLIRRPVLAPSLSLINLLNDDAGLLSEVTHALGSKTRVQDKHTGKTQVSSSAGPKLSKFRELLSKNVGVLSTLGSPPSNVTIFAPSDQAFDNLRYDLRALINGDESLIPTHWDSAHRAQLLDRLLRRHLVVGASITTDNLNENLNDQPEALRIFTNEAGASMRLSQVGVELVGQQADQPSPKSRLLEANLLGRNGVLNIIDCVLGEPLETLDSILHSMEIKQQQQQQQQSESSSSVGELHELIKSQLSNLAANGPSQELGSAEHTRPSSDERHRQQSISEFELISKSIGQFLESQHQQQASQLGSSLNISLQLSRLSGFASDEPAADSAEQLAWFKDTQRQLTWFAPSDLAWLRFAQAQPEIYRPLFGELLAQAGPGGSALALALTGQQQQQQQLVSGSGSGSNSNDLSASQAGNGAGINQQEAGSLEQGGVPAALVAAALPSSLLKQRTIHQSQSSQRIKQILERHLVADAKIQAESLNQLDRVQTMRATLRLADQPAPRDQTSGDMMQQQLQQQQTATSSSRMGAFAALHSIVTGQQQQQPAANRRQQQQQQSIRKTISFDSISGAQISPLTYSTSNGNLYIIDRVLTQPDDASYIQQTGSAASASSSMASLLGAHNSLLLDAFQFLFGAAPSAASLRQSSPANYGALILLATLICGIVLLSILATILLIRRRRQLNKLGSGHRQLESGLTSSSSANSDHGSTSTTKSL